MTPQEVEERVEGVLARYEHMTDYISDRVAAAIVRQITERLGDRIEVTIAIKDPK